MRIKVNNKEMELPEASTLQQVAETLALPARGVAMAVNNRMVPRAEWLTRIICENDSLVVIKAACGG